MMVGKLIGKYQVIGELAQGRLGIIYRAQLANQAADPAREFLLKTINFNLFTKSLQVQLKARFRREIYAQRQLQHRNIVQVYELLTVGNEAFLALENFPGATLHDLLMRQGVPNAVEALSYGRQMLAALDYAHRVSYLDESDFPRTGIVHGDIRLSNLLLDARGRVKLTDFNIVHKVIGGDLRKVYPELVAYQSPEMQRGHAPDYRSDIFAAGSVFYEMLTGRLPSVATHNEDWGYARPQTTDTEAESLLAIRPDVPHELAAAISRAVRRNPQDRFATMADFLKAVQSIEVQAGGGEAGSRAKSTTGSFPQAPALNDPTPTLQLLPNAPGALAVEAPRSTAITMKQPVAVAKTMRQSGYANALHAGLPGDTSFDVAPPRVKRQRRERWLVPASFACALGGLLAGAYFFSSPRSTEGLASNVPAGIISTATAKAETQPEAAAPLLPAVEAKDASLPAAMLDSPKLVLARQAEQQERYGEALKAYEEYVLANPRTAAASNLGVRISALRQFQARVNSAKEAIAAARYDEARMHFSEALKLRPTSRLAQNGLRDSAAAPIATPLTVPAMTVPGATVPVTARRDAESKDAAKEPKDNTAPRTGAEEKEPVKDKKEAAKPVPISYRPAAGQGNLKRTLLNSKTVGSSAPVNKNSLAKTGVAKTGVGQAGSSKPLPNKPLVTKPSLTTGAKKPAPKSGIALPGKPKP